MTEGLYYDPAITAPVDISDRAARLLGVVASITAPVDISDRAARLLGVVASITAPVDIKPATLVVAGSGAANGALTLTLPAAGVGLFHYVTHIYIDRHATALLAGGLTLAATTTNLGGLTWRTGNQASITVATADGMILTDIDLAHPIKSAVANTASTIVMPAPGLGVLWTGWVAYYTGT